MTYAVVCNFLSKTKLQRTKTNDLGKPMGCSMKLTIKAVLISNWLELIFKKIR